MVEIRKVTENFSVAPQVEAADFSAIAAAGSAPPVRHEAAGEPSHGERSVRLLDHAMGLVLSEEDKRGVDCETKQSEHHW